MSKKYLLHRVGETHVTNEGYTLTIIAGGDKNNHCFIQIDEWIKQVHSSNIKNGRVKYPYAPNVVGVAYLGEGKYSKKEYPKLYELWHSMLKRAYSKAYEEINPTYKDVTVCNQWHNFQVFAEWAEEHLTPAWDLDKDLLVRGNKLYSPETCIFIPHQLNSFLSTFKQVKNHSNRTKKALQLRELYKDLLPTEVLENIL